jgi:hypothetical protein
MSDILAIILVNFLPCPLDVSNSCVQAVRTEDGPDDHLTTDIPLDSRGFL